MCNKIQHKAKRKKHVAFFEKKKKDDSVTKVVAPHYCASVFKNPLIQ